MSILRELLHELTAPRTSERVYAQPPPAPQPESATEKPAIPMLVDIPMLTEQLRELRGHADATMAAMRLDNDLRLDVREQIALKLAEQLIYKFNDTTPTMTLLGKAVYNPADFMDLAFELADEFMRNRNT